MVHDVRRAAVSISDIVDGLGLSCIIMSAITKVRQEETDSNSLDSHQISVQHSILGMCMKGKFG